MSMSSPPRFLRNILLLDAATCLGCGGLQLAAPAWMHVLTGLPGVLLLETGIFLLLYAAALCWLASRKPVPAAPVWLIVAGNTGWALACMALLAGPWVEPTAWGRAYLVLNIATVLLMALLQWRGLRGLRSGGLATA